MKAKLRRGTILFLSVMLTAAMLCGMTLSAVDTPDRGGRLYRGMFSYTGNKDTFYYGDSYFDVSGDADNEHLRTFSAALAFSVLGTSGEDTKELMTNIGMEPDRIVMEDMVRGTPDTIGTVIAKKQLKDQPLVAVAIRGSDYAGEWANNVTAGTDGDASGFAAAAAKVAQRIQTYLSDNDIAKAKIWVVGYSRAGGIANLVGKAMNEDPGAFCTTAEDIYVYTYEAPRCSEDDTLYKNIHNIFDVNDLVPHFYPESWGLHLNGIEEKIGDPSDTMTAKCFHVATEGYIKEISERPKSEFLRQFEEFAGSTVSRASYAASTEQHLSALCDICLSKSHEERKALLDYLAKVGELAQSYPNLKTLVMNLLNDPDSEYNINTISALLSGWLDEARESVQPPFTDGEYATIQNAVRPMVTFFLTLADVDVDYHEKVGTKTTYYNFYHLVTLFANIKEFVMPHLNVNVFEKLKQMDSYYTAGVRIKPGDVIIGQNRYTFDENGWPLEDIVRASGFTEQDMEIWRNGYELRINNELTEIDEPDIELYLKAAGKFDKSMSMYKFYELDMTKSVGFKTYPIDKSIKLKDNPICLTVPQEIAKKCVRYGVARVDDDGAYKLDTEIVKLDNGDTQLWVNGIYPAFYASAIDDRRWCTVADVDRDDEVSAMDVTHIQRNLASLEDFDDVQKVIADVDGDGKMSVVDSTWISRWLVKQEVPYAIGDLMEITEI